MLCRALLTLAAIAAYVNVVVLVLQSQRPESFASRWSPVIEMPSEGRTIKHKNESAPSGSGHISRSGVEAPERYVMEKIEYRVRPITRYIVTRWHESDLGSGIEQKGEYDNALLAYSVGYALARDEHNRLGWPLGDTRLMYPEQPAPAVPMGQGVLISHPTGGDKGAGTINAPEVYGNNAAA